MSALDLCNLGLWLGDGADNAMARRIFDAICNGVTISDARLPGAPLIYVNPAFGRMKPHSNQLARGLFIVVVSVGMCMGTQTALALPASTLRTITRIGEAHSLSADEAKHSYPVHFRAVVTYYDPHNDGKHASLFLHDSTGSIFALMPADWHWIGAIPHSGSLVDVVGVTAPGDYASLITQTQMEVIGESSEKLLAKPVSFTHLATGIEDAQYVQIEGVVRSVTQSGHRVTLNIAMADGLIGASSINDPNADYYDLVDSKVLIQGSIGTLFNDSRQMVGTHLLFPDLHSVNVEEFGPKNPFSLPLRSVVSLSRFMPTGALPHRIHVRGRVTLQWPGMMVCVQDDTSGVCAKTSGRMSLELGQIADVTGFVVSGGYRPMLVDSVFRSLGGNAPVEVPRVTPIEALQGHHDSEVIQIEGQLIGRDLAASQPTLLLSSQGSIFPVMLPKEPSDDEVATIRIGSTLRITGICAVVLDAEKMAIGNGSAAIQSFHILARSPKDVKVLKAAPWWTPERALLGFAIALAISGAVFVWVVVLRRRVEQQTKEIRVSEERFRHMALHDGLTGLPTRHMLHERLRLAPDKTRRFHTGIALLMLDLDDFKGVNDKLGHDGGDETLRVMARRIKESIRATDLVARMGGDEFVVFLDDLVEPGHAEDVAETIVSSLCLPIPIGERSISVSVSVGVCETFDQDIDVETMLQQVDMAMYEAKAHGRNRFHVFTSDMACAAIAKQRMKDGLARALDEHELEVYYQPLFSTQDPTLTGFEALLRWRSKSLGFVMPSDFIPLAEETGMIVPIGEWVIREACHQIGNLERQLGRQFEISINLSPRQLLQDKLPKVIKEALEENRRDPGSVKIEITENILMTDNMQNHQAIVRIRELGVRIAIDDFGIGFSSLSYISRFPVDWIKIDRSFISECTNDPASLAVVRAIIAMAHSLDIQVTAEGVETLDQLSLVTDENCDAIQGYYYSRPVRFCDLPQLIHSLARPREHDLDIGANQLVA